MKIKIRQLTEKIIPKIIEGISDTFFTLKINQEEKFIIYPIFGIDISPGITANPEIDLKIFYVSLTGNDNNTGILPESNTPNGPVATFYRATQLALGYTGPENTEIHIRGGEYPILGTAQKPVFYLEGVTKSIKYKNYNNEPVIITGSEGIPYTRFTLINSGDPRWSRFKSDVRSFIYVADVSDFDLGEWAYSYSGTIMGGGFGGTGGDYPGVPSLIYNDTPMTLARWPNKTGITTSGYSLYECATISNTFGSVIDTGTNSGHNPGNPKRPGIFKYRNEYDSVVSRWVNNNALSDGAWITIFGRFDWASDTFPVLGITLLNDASGGATASIKVGSAWSSYGIQNYSLCNGSNTYEPANTTPRRWFIQNIIDELDAPGEYYIDRTNKKLYFYPPTPITVTASIQFTHRANKGPSPILKQYPLQGNYEHGFNPFTGAPVTGTVGNTFGYFPYPGWTGSYINGIGYSPVGSHQGRYVSNWRSVISSMFKFFKCKNLTIEGITFKNCTGSGIDLQLSDNIQIKNCHLYNMDRNAIRSMGGREVVVKDCVIHDIGNDAVINVGGNRRTLIPANNYITGCNIRRWARHAPDRGYGAVVNGCGNIVSYNTFTECGGEAVHQAASSLNIIEYNNFANLVTELDDAGAIYHGRSPTSFGNIIRNNFFNTIGNLLPGGRGYVNQLPYPTFNDPVYTGCLDPERSLTESISSPIYFDDKESFHTIQNNTFYNCVTTGPYGCIFFNGGIGHNVGNNIFIDCYNGIAASRNDLNYWKNTTSSIEAATVSLNIFDDPWYDEDPGYNQAGGITFNTGYTVWNNYFSNMGSQQYFINSQQKSWFGMFNNVDIRSSTLAAAEPRLLQLMEVLYAGLAARLGISLTYASSVKNDYYNNVILGCSGSSWIGSTGSFSVTNPLIGGFTGVNAVLASGITFTNKNNLNFKLTPSDLSVITSLLPGFQDTQFEKIPLI